jgi:hypothetical protein
MLPVLAIVTVKFAQAFDVSLVMYKRAELVAGDTLKRNVFVPELTSRFGLTGELDATREQVAPEHPATLVSFPCLVN